MRNALFFSLGRYAAWTLAFCLCAFCSVTFSANSQDAEPSADFSVPFLPNPAPFFEASAPKRIRPEFRVESFTYQPYGAKEILRYEMPFFQAGNKKIAVRLTTSGMTPTQDQSIFLHADGNCVARLSWWGSHKGGFGYPFKDIEGKPHRLSIDREREIIRWEKPFLFENGEPGLFWYELKRNPENERQILLSWEIEGSEEVLAALPKGFGVSLWLTSGNEKYRGKKILLGDREFTQAHRQELMEGIQRHSFAGDFTFDAENPGHEMKIFMDDLRGGLEESISISQTSEKYSFIYRVQNSMKKTLILDFGESVEMKKSLPPINGHDFWTADALDMAQPPVRNQMRNPSFEQGLRYWRWIPGGAKYTKAEEPKFKVVPEGLFGRNALYFTGNQHSAPGIQSFPFGLEKGKTYTLSFYAKSRKPGSVTVAPASGGRGGQFQWLKELSNPLNKYETGPEWKRYSRTFTDDGAGIMLNIGTYSQVWIDGIQIEEGEKPTEFTSAPIEAFLETNDSDDDFEFGETMNARLLCVGKPNTKGKVRVLIRNPFREVLLDRTFEVSLKSEKPETAAETALETADGIQNGCETAGTPAGLQEIPLELDAIREKLGQGIFCVETVFTVEGFREFNEFHRFSVMKRLQNTHRTKNVFGNLSAITRISRGDDLARKYRDWGFGSSSWGRTEDSLEGGELSRMMRENGILNFYHSVSENGTPEVKEKLKNYREWTEVTPEMEALIERNAYEQVLLNPKDLFPVWGFGNEEEGSHLIRNRQFDEYFKAQHAAAKGILRANPEAVVVPTCGTSGYSLLRGYEAIEGYLAASVKHNFKYGAVAVHPYWNLDGASLSTFDLDEETARLREQMERYGYGKETPIYFTECFNVPGERFPNWGLDLWGDSWLYGRLSYDFGNREFVQAASIARLYLICLKYFPQVQHVNIWRSEPFIDVHLSPYLLCKGVNTLGNLLGDVEFYADIKPAKNVRGYAFRLPDGRAITALWCIDAQVEDGLRRGPILRAKLPKDTRFIDFMGNPRRAPIREGVSEIQLTCAPLFLISAKPQKLASALLNAVTDSETSGIAVSSVPQMDGTIHVVLANRTGNVQAGIVRVTNEKNEKVLDYVLKPGEKIAVPVPEFQGSTNPCTLSRWVGTVTLEPKPAQTHDSRSVSPSESSSSQVRSFQFTQEFFRVPCVEGEPDWEKIPAISLTNPVKQSSRLGAVALEVGEDLSARYQAAWRKDGKLWVRMEIQDDSPEKNAEIWNLPRAAEQLFQLDGCAMLYFDCGANAGMNALEGRKGFDLDDYRYDIAPPEDWTSERAPIWRTREVNHQFADGLNMPKKEEAAEKILVRFEKTEKGFTYTAEFDQRFVEPFTLKAGAMAGFGAAVWDRDSADPKNDVPMTRGLSNTSDTGLTCEGNPHLFPLMILAE